MKELSERLREAADGPTMQRALLLEASVALSERLRLDVEVVGNARHAARPGNPDEWDDVTLSFAVEIIRLADAAQGER